MESKWNQKSKVKNIKEKISHDEPLWQKKSYFLLGKN